MFKFRHLYIYLHLKSFSVVVPLNPHQGSVLDLSAGGLKRPQTPRRKLCLHFILYLATPLTPNSK